MRIMLITALLIGCGAPAKQGPGATTPGASPPNAQGTASQEGDDEDCHDEAPTGSLLEHRVCRDKFERDGNRKDAEDFGHMARSSPTMSH